MSKDKVHSYYVADMSGSMGRLVDDVRGNLRQTIQSAQDETAIKTKMSILFFDTDFTLVADHKKADKLDANAITNAYVPRGGTALNDAVMMAIRSVQSYDWADRNVVIVMTDGQENSSVEYTLADVNAAIKAAGDDIKFLFVGVGVDGFTQASKYVGTTRAAVTMDAVGMEAYGNIAKSMSLTGGLTHEATKGLTVIDEDGNVTNN